MLTSSKMDMMKELIAGSSRDELIWLSGYLAGVVGQIPSAVSSPAGAAPGSKPSATPLRITIAYGTETGNAKRLATDFAAKAKKKGIQAKLVGLEQYRLGDLPKEEYLLTVISTQGDGEPPAAAKKFYDHIHQDSLRLDRLRYSVLALGDTSYPLFCKAGEDLDQQLQKIGAHRLSPLQKCDTDYETEAGKWFESVLQQLDLAPQPAAAPATPPAKPIGKKIYTGAILSNTNLNDRGSEKQTHHLEIEADGVEYLPGDSLGIVPENPAALVEAILSLTGADGNQLLPHRMEEWPLSHLLRKKLNIVYLPERVVNKYAAIVGQDIPATKIGLLDLLKIYPVKDARQFHAVVAILEPIAPRLYSISSSPGTHPGEIHLTVARDRFSVNGETKYGVCSDGLSQLTPGQTVEFYIHHNAQFRLPAPGTDIIMIGPGTGIAPFRSFIAERDSRGSQGKNWLFFGDQHFTTDFLYQSEIQDWVNTGVLTRVNTAFSRDQQEKVYVQHKMRRHAADLFAWLQSGAHVYICGAKQPMSEDVENTLLAIIREEGNKNPAQAEAYLDELKATGRYVKDVY